MGNFINFFMTKSEEEDFFVFTVQSSFKFPWEILTLLHKELFLWNNLVLNSALPPKLRRNDEVDSQISSK